MSRTMFTRFTFMGQETFMDDVVVSALCVLFHVGLGMCLVHVKVQRMHSDLIIKKVKVQLLID